MQSYLEFLQKLITLRYVEEKKGKQKIKILSTKENRLNHYFVSHTQFSMERAKTSNTEEESAKYLVSAVENYVTPAKSIIALSKS